MSRKTFLKSLFTRIIFFHWNYLQTTKRAVKFIRLYFAQARIFRTLYIRTHVQNIKVRISEIPRSFFPRASGHVFHMKFFTKRLNYFQVFKFLNLNFLGFGLKKKHDSKRLTRLRFTNDNFNGYFVPVGKRSGVVCVCVFQAGNSSKVNAFSSTGYRKMCVIKFFFFNFKFSQPTWFVATVKTVL